LLACGDLDREPGLADTTCTRQREQALGAQEVTQLSQLRFSPNEAAELHR